MPAPEAKMEEWLPLLKSREINLALRVAKHALREHFDTCFLQMAVQIYD